MARARELLNAYVPALLPSPKEGLPKAPYPGLRSFRMDEWPIFFGREIATEDVIKLLDKTPFAILHGSSGCGKSSLIFAGVLPRLGTRAKQSNIRRATALMRPSSAPLASLTTALAAGLGHKDEAGIFQILNRGREAAPHICNYIRDSGFSEFCLYIDQFEEVFRLTGDADDEAALFIDVLIGLSGIQIEEQPWWRNGPSATMPVAATVEKAGALQIIATMRSEFFGDCTRFNGLAELVNRTQYLLPPMSDFDLERAIRDPAELYGRRVERKLALELIAEASQESDPLPLIQHALMLMWEKSDSQLTVETYRRLASPGRTSRKKHDTHASKTNLGSVFAAHVDRVIDVHGPNVGIAETLIRALVDIDSQRRATRRPQRLSTLIELVGEEQETALRLLIDDMRAEGASFLRPLQRDQGSPLNADTVIDISHEALFRAWPRAADPALDPDLNQPKGWLLREYEDGLIWRALAVQARAHEQNPAELLDAAATPRYANWFRRVGARAAWAERHLIERKPDLAPDQQPEWVSVQSLIRESERNISKAIARDAANRRTKRILWFVGGVVVAGMIVLGVLSLVLASREQALRANTEAFQAKKKAQALKERLANAETRLNQLSTYIGLGSDNRSKVVSASTGVAVAPSSLQGGDRVRLIQDVMVRADIPRSDRTAQGRGFLKRESTVTIVSAPVRVPGYGYWARVEGSVIAFGSLYLYYTGADPPGTKAEDSVDARARKLKDYLTDYGFRIERLSRNAQSAGKSEIRFFRPADLDQAQILSTFVNYVTSGAAVARSADRPRLRDFGGENGAPTKRLEIWIDLGVSNVAPPRRPARPPAATPPAADLNTTNPNTASPPAPDPKAAEPKTEVSIHP